MATDGRILSNGRYRVVLTATGTGFSAAGPLALSRWSADAVADVEGTFVYLRDLDTGDVWSAGSRPIGGGYDRSTLHYRHGRALVNRSVNGIESRMETCVDPRKDAELRRIEVRNTSRRARRIEVTTYAEIVLHHRAADASHPAFAKLFVQTEHVAGERALLAWRRPRSREESWPWMIHALSGSGALEFESDRVRFLGRGRDVRCPVALDEGAPALTGTVGKVLDPVFALRTVLELAPGARGSLTLVSATAHERDAALALVSGYREATEVEAAFVAASKTASLRARKHGLRRADAEHLQSIAARMLAGDPSLRLRALPLRALRARGATRSAGTDGELGGGHADASRLAPLPIGAELGIGSDSLLMVVHEGHGRGIAVAGRAATAVGYWRALGLAAAWVAVCGEEGCDGGGECALWRTAAAGGGASPAVCIAANGAADKWSADRLERLDASAHLVLRDGSDQLQPDSETGEPAGRQTATGGHRTQVPVVRPTAGGHAAGADGYGAFSADGREYRMSVDSSAPAGLPPMPWVNVIANPDFGFLVSETGAGSTWSRNSREHRLTPWSNDPVSDPHVEALYVRDEQSAAWWSPLPGPARGEAPYQAVHGFGYTRWHHAGRGLEQETTTFVAASERVRFVRVRIRNPGSEPRSLALVWYCRLVLGVDPATDARYVATEIDRASKAVLATSALSEVFADGVAFVAAVAPAGADVSLCADRATFLGPQGAPAAPAAVAAGGPLDGRAGAGLDPCAAVRAAVTVAAGAEVECTFLLGEASSRRDARELIARCRADGAVAAALEESRARWDALLGAVAVETPSAAIDFAVNGWPLYQTVACRLWGRSAFYQSGGAFGFRDQLQDSTALVYARPDLVRAQILLHAAHQFVEGDVMHWWHPPADRGMRTRFSDDLLWLPYVTAFYIEASGDRAVLDESVEFVAARSLEEGEEEAYLAVEPAGESATLYEHCCRALDRSLACGAHGLPLMGAGDWNDGMNKVGAGGKGESVWLGFFLHALLRDFSLVCEDRGDVARARRYREHGKRLGAALEQSGWDGGWYLRAYYDDGTPLGSSANDECRIDALVQAWAVISAAARPERARRALDAVEEQLVSEKAGIIRLLAPPFDRCAEDPGYIKGYVPGIRENGGQYTHAALWVVRAMAELGRRDRAARWLEMLSPLTHTATRERTDVYKVEPYVVAADVYGVEPHVGRGGWTWYTGSAAWTYRIALESVLGFTLEDGTTLRLLPCVPDDWPDYRIRYRLPAGETVYDIHVGNPERCSETVVSAVVDGESVPVEGGVARIPLLGDGKTHVVEVRLGARHGRR